MSTKKCMLALASLFSMLAVGGGQAHADRYEMSVGAGSHFVPMESMDALTDDSAYVGPVLSIALRLPELQLVPNTGTELVLGYESGLLTGESFQAIQSRFNISTVSLSTRLRKRLFSKGSAFVQVGLGWQRSELALMDVSGDEDRRLEGNSNAFSGLAAIGFDLALIQGPKAPFSLALRTEIGYQASTSLAMDAAPLGGDALSIPRKSRDLGSVNASGATIRWGIVVSM